MKQEPGRASSAPLPPGLLDELATLGSLAHLSGGARTSRELATAALDVLRRATGATGGVILFNAGDGFDIAARYGLGTDLVDLVRDAARGGSPMMVALETTLEPLLFDRGHAPFRPDILEAMRADGIAAVGLIGLRVAGKVVGVLGVGWHGNEPAPSAIAVLPQTAALVAVGLQNARLVERLEATLASEQHLVAELATLQSLTQIGETAEAFDDLAHRTIRVVINLLGARGAVYALLTGDVLRYAAMQGVPEAVADLATSRPARENRMVRRFESGDGSYFARYADETDYWPETMAFARSEGWTGYAVIPIRIEDRLAAIIAVYFDRPLEELRLDGRALDAIGRVAAISLANFRLRDQLSSSEAHYRTLFEQSSEALVLFSDEAEVIAANRAALALFRTDLDELIRFGAPTGSPDDPAEAERRSAYVASQTATTLRRTGTRPDGSTFRMEETITPVLLDGSRRSLVLIRDLTGDERIQAELLQAQKMEALGQLVAGVAHELNNPLASIVAFSQLIRTDERLPEDLRSDAQLLQQEAQRTRRIVGNLLDFARRRAPERVPTSVRALVDSVIALQSYGITAASIAVALDLPPDLPTIDVDRGQMQQVLLNVTLNAIQAIRSTGQAGTLAITGRRVTTDAGEPAVRLSVTDDGPGIPEDLRSRLFVPFFTTRAPGDGTGLGLSVSFGIVGAHGGRLWFEPGPGGRGAAFFLELPVHAATGAATARPADGPNTGTAAAPTVPSHDLAAAAPPRVLVLDDEPAIRAFLTKALRLGRFDPVVAERGADAVELARAEAFDAVLVDHRMPDMSGLAVYEAIVAERPEMADRFVFMSGDVLNPELQQFIQGREIALLAKPFDLDTALRIVRNVVSRS